MNANSKVKGTVIIGNGFDLSLGLPTRYCDFFERKDFFPKDDSKLCAFLLESMGRDKWSDLEQLLSVYADERFNPIDPHMVQSDILPPNKKSSLQKIREQLCDGDIKYYHKLNSQSRVTGDRYRAPYLSTKERERARL